MRKLLISLLLLLSLSFILPGCGGYGSSGSAKTSNIPYRALVSNSVSAGTATAGLYIINAQTDVHPPGLAPITAGNSPGMMVVTPNRAQTVVFSGNNNKSSDNAFSIINNAAETNATSITLAGYTESIVVSPDSTIAYVAVPTAPIIGQSPGSVNIIGVVVGTLNGTVNIPSVHYLSLSNNGNRLLAFSTVLSSLAPPCTDPTPSYVFLVTPSDVGVVSCPVVPVPGFDHPVQAFFSSDDSTAYLVNCGPECGGTQASIQPLDLTTPTPTPGVAVPVPAATESLVDGSTMYLAGTPYSGGVPSQPCTGQITAATTCGLLTIFDLNTMTATNPAPIVITDGYHNRMALAANGQLFIGARTCTEIFAPPGSEVRGCLSIYNPNLLTQSGVGTVVIPPANGDATGIQPITTRTVVYVVQGGSLGIYDTATDALQSIQITNIAGQFVDVKTIDF